MRVGNRSDPSTGSEAKPAVSWRTEPSETPMISDSFAARLPRHSTCSSCGLRRIAGVRFCQGCGLDFDAEVRSSRVRSWSVRGPAPARPIVPLQLDPPVASTDARDRSTAASADGRGSARKRGIVVGDGILDLSRRQVEILGIGIGVVAAALIGLLSR